jgi:hypothetical protein
MTNLGRSAAAFVIILAGLGAAEVVHARGAGSGPTEPNHSTQQVPETQPTGVGDSAAACAHAGQGQAVIDCLADAIAKVAERVVTPTVAAKAPRLVEVVAQAATIRGKPKAEALNVLNKLLSITRGLSTKSEADVRPAVNAIAGAFARAISVIERKG